MYFVNRIHCDCWLCCRCYFSLFWWIIHANVLMKIYASINIFAFWYFVCAHTFLWPTPFPNFALVLRYIWCKYLDTCCKKCLKCTANFWTPNKKIQRIINWVYITPLKRGEKVCAFGDNSIVAAPMLPSVTVISVLIFNNCNTKKPNFHTKH